MYSVIRNHSLAHRVHYLDHSPGLQVRQSESLFSSSCLLFRTILQGPSFFIPLLSAETFSNRYNFEFSRRNSAHFLKQEKLPAGKRLLGNGDTQPTEGDDIVCKSFYETTELIQEGKVYLMYQLQRVSYFVVGDFYITFLILELDIQFT